MVNKEDNLLANFNGNLGVSPSSLNEFHLSTGLNLPDDYVEFLRRRNGGEGFIGDSYLILWKLEELVEFNRDYEVTEYCPGLLLIGSSGGGEAYAFDTREANWPMVQVPFVGMDPSVIERVGNSFSDFLRALAKMDDVP